MHATTFTTMRDGTATGPLRAARATAKSRACAHAGRVACLALLALLVARPAAAVADGPALPVATSYVAKLAAVPPGLDARVVNGDQSMWLRVAAGLDVTVLDYTGQPYLRFTRSGVDVNENSAMYYLNTWGVNPPASLTPARPDWQPVSRGRTYQWHDGRLHALTAVALAPGARYVGRWTVPMVIDGRRASVSGTVWHTGDPSIVWFWPVAVIMLCALAGWRVRDPALDRRIARGLAGSALVAVTVAVVGIQLYGRPSVSDEQVVELVVLLALIAWGASRLVRRRSGAPLLGVISVVAIGVGIQLIPTLLHGDVLLGVPGFVGRAAAVVCLGAGASLVPFAFRVGDQAPPEPSSADEPFGDDLDEAIVAQHEGVA